MFLSCATRQIENVGPHFLCTFTEDLPGTVFCFSFFKKQLLVVEQTFFLGLSDLALFLGGATGIEDTNCCLLLFLQERTRSFDSFSMHSLENSLIDIMRAEQDSLKGLFPHYLLPGRGSCSPLWIEENMTVIRSQIFCRYRDALKARSVLLSDRETLEMIYTLDDSFEVVFFYLLDIFIDVFASCHMTMFYRFIVLVMLINILLYANASKHSSIVINLGESSTQNKCHSVGYLRLCWGYFFFSSCLSYLGRYSFSHQGGDGPLPMNGMQMVFM